jgi:ELMO/CED-12 family
LIDCCPECTFELFNALQVHKEVISRRDFVHYSVYTVLTIKKIHPTIHPQFAPSFSRCIEQLHGYETLRRDVETLRLEAFDCENQEHEAKLRKLWEALMPDTPLVTRVSKQWQDIGFQVDYSYLLCLCRNKYLGFFRCRVTTPKRTFVAWACWDWKTCSF